MRLLKNCNANNRLPVSRNKSQHSIGPVRQTNRSNSPEIKLDGSWASRLTFVEDFTLEHSFPGLQITSIETLRSF